MRVHDSIIDCGLSLSRSLTQARAHTHKGRRDGVRRESDSCRRTAASPLLHLFRIYKSSQTFVFASVLCGHKVFVVAAKSDNCFRRAALFLRRSFWRFHDHHFHSTGWIVVHPLLNLETVDSMITTMATNYVDNVSRRGIGQVMDI